MYELPLPPDFPLPQMNRLIADSDTMYLQEDAHYIAVGLSALRVIEAALDGRTPRRILDLPSGFGRVTRVLRARFPEAAITACDLDTDAIQFCAIHFDAQPLPSVRDFGRLQLGGAYDLIWVGSLITHLPAPQVRAFFAAMARHMAPHSVLIVSLHGASIIPRLQKTHYGLEPDMAAAVIADYEQAGFGYRDYSTGGVEYGVALSNENYGISLTGEPWLREVLPSCGLHVVAYHERAWDDHHDIVVAKLLTD